MEVPERLESDATSSERGEPARSVIPMLGEGTPFAARSVGGQLSDLQQRTNRTHLREVPASVAAA